MFNIISGNRVLLNRRRFFGACSAAACAACRLHAAPSGAAEEAGPRTRVRVVFSHPGKPIEGWPYKGFDYEARKKELLTPLRQAMKDIKFLPVSVSSAEEGQRVLAADAEVDGYLIWLLGIPSPAPPLFAKLDRPVVAVNDFYGGGLGLLRGPRVVSISSSNFGDVVDAVRAIDCTTRLRGAVLLDITERNAQASAEAFRRNTGINVKVLPGNVIASAYEKTSATEAREFAATWIGRAQRVAETNEAEIVRSGRMYAAIRTHSEDRKGAAIRSLLPLNEKLTTLIMAPALKKTILHMAKSVSNLEDDKACRTKLVAEVANARKLYQGWSVGWHRVTIYGDHRDRFENLSRLLGFEFVEEG